MGEEKSNWHFIVLAIVRYLLPGGVIHVKVARKKTTTIRTPGDVGTLYHIYDKDTTTSLRIILIIRYQKTKPNGFWKAGNYPLRIAWIAKPTCGLDQWENL